MTTPSETTSSIDDASTTPTAPIPFNFILPVPAAAPARVITHVHPVPTVLLVAAPPPALTDLFVDTISGALEQWQDEALKEAPGQCEVCGKAKEEVLMTPVSFLGEGEGAETDDSGGDDKASTAAAGPQNEEQIDGVVGVPEANSDSAQGQQQQQQQQSPQKRVDVLITPICAQQSCAALARAKLRRVVEGHSQASSDAPSQPQQQQQNSFHPQALDDLAEAAQSFHRLPGPEDVRCRVCGSARDTKKCAGCGRVRYCGKECQRLDWRAGHKRICGVSVVSGEGGE